MRHYQCTNVFTYIQRVVVERSTKWEAATGGFTILETAAAMTGEAGEAANVAKKIRRLELGMQNGPHGYISDIDDLRNKLASEIADTFIYLMLLAERGGITGDDLYKSIAVTFNRKSDEFGFDEHLVPF